MRFTLFVFTLCVLVVPSGSYADTILFPTNWTNYQPCTGDHAICRGEAVEGSPTIPVDIPSDIAGQLIGRPGWGILISDILVGDRGFSNTYNKPVPVREGFLDVYGRNSLMYTYWLFTPMEGWPKTLCLWAGKRPSTSNWDGPVSWQGPCIPITWGDKGLSCSVKGPDVLLDHGVVRSGEASVARADASISCNGNASGHLALPSGGDTIPLGDGYSKLTTDIGPLSSTRPFAKGVTPIELNSTLHDVEPGTWTASATIVVVLD